MCVHFLASRFLFLFLRTRVGWGNVGDLGFCWWPSVSLLVSVGSLSGALLRLFRWAPFQESCFDCFLLGHFWP